jgi:hypothetical protein
VHLIDCFRPYGSPERERTGCYSCWPEARMLGQRTYVVDRRGAYRLTERFADLRSPYHTFTREDARILRSMGIDPIT